MKVLVYGNCQARPIGHFLNQAAPDYEIIEVAAVHTINRNKLDVLYEKFEAADVVLSQPIGSGFGDISTDILQKKFSKIDWFFFPSIYFGGHFPYLQYLRKENGTLLGPLKEYHDKRIIKGFLSQLSIENCLNFLLEENANYCAEFRIKSIEESIGRESNLDIKVMDKVLELEKHERVFHTFNHPSNKILWEVVCQFLKIFGRTPIEGSRPYITQFLDNVSASITADVVAVASLDYAPQPYSVDRSEIDLRDLIRKKL